MSIPLRVGITGGIGAGKSIITRVFKILGIPIYDADERAKWLMAHSDNLQSAIKVLFGDQSFVNGELNRKHIGKLAFSKPNLLAQLNALVHPEVERDFHSWLQENNTARYIIKEAALIFETGSYKNLDRIILVTAPIETRINRVLKRDNQRTEEDVRAIMSRQLQTGEKEDLADVILINDGTNLLIPKILKLHEQFSNT